MGKLYQFDRLAFQQKALRFYHLTDLQLSQRSQLQCSFRSTLFYKLNDSLLNHLSYKTYTRVNNTLGSFRQCIFDCCFRVAGNCYQHLSLL